WAIVILVASAAFSQAPPRARSYPSPLPSRARALPIGKPVKIPTPLGLPPVPIPADNPPTEETIALGRALFFEKLFARDNSMSCATCHDPKSAMADPRQFSKGVGDLLGTRNAPTVINAAYYAT